MSLTSYRAAPSRVTVTVDMLRPKGGYSFAAVSTQALYPHQTVFFDLISHLFRVFPLISGFDRNIRYLGPQIDAHVGSRIVVKSLRRTWHLDPSWGETGMQ